MTAHLRSLAFPASPEGRAPDALILLPGAYDTPEHFLQHGLVDDLRASGLALDLILAETDLTAVTDGSLVRRLQEHVVLPTRAAGYRRVWLGGISIGGLTAMIHTDEYPGATDGLCLLAPYPGNRTITAEIARAGGLAGWSPDELSYEEGERRGWRALARLAAESPDRLWLGFGAQDRFAAGHQLMAQVLPGNRRVELPGAHDWPTWRALWQRFLAQWEAGL